MPDKLADQPLKARLYVGTRACAAVSASKLHRNRECEHMVLMCVCRALITFVSVGYASLSVSRQSSAAALGIGDKEALLETGGDDPSVCVWVGYIKLDP